MHSENTFIVHPANAEQETALKAFVKALKIKFEVAKGNSPYNPDFVAKIEKSRKDFKAGKGTVLTMEELNKLWK